MFSLIKKDFDEIMKQDIYLFQNDEKVKVEIYVDRNQRAHLNTRIFTCIITDPKSIEYGVSLTYSDGNFFISIDRTSEYLLEDIDLFIKNINRLKNLSDELSLLFMEYE